MAVVAASSATRTLLKAFVVLCLAGVAFVFDAVVVVVVVVDELFAMDDGTVCVVTLTAVPVADNFRSSVLVIVVAGAVAVLAIVSVVRSFCINWSTIDGSDGSGSEDDVLRPLTIHSPNERSAIRETTTTNTFIWQ